MEIVSYRTDLRDHVINFAKEYGLLWGNDPAVFRWKYERPLPKSVSASPSTRLWLLLNENRVLGMLGVLPITVSYLGTERPAVVAMDVHVHPEMRGQGMGKRLLETFERSCDFRLMLFSTELAHSIYLRRGYRNIGGPASFVWALRTMRTAVHFAASKLFRIGVSSPPPLSSLSSAIAEQIPGCQPEKGNNCREVNDFLTTCRRRYQFAVVRDWETLHWHYHEHPTRAGQLFSIRDQRGHIRCLFALAWKKFHRLNCLLLADIYTPPNNSEISRLVIDKLPVMARVARADLYSVVATSDDLTGMLSGFDRRRVCRSSVWLPKEIQNECDPARWYISAGDSDYFG